MKFFKIALLASIVIASIIAVCFTVAGESEVLINVKSFLESQSAREWVNPGKKVLAFYYAWYGDGNPESGMIDVWHGWKGGHGPNLLKDLLAQGKVEEPQYVVARSTHLPLLGPYDSYEEESIRHHMKWAKEAWIDGFIVSWWGISPATDEGMSKILDIADKYGRNITIYYETNRCKTKEERIKRGIEDLTHVLNKYGTHPAFLKINGKPVIFVYSRVMGQVSLDEWVAIVEGTRKTAKADFLLNVEDLTGISEIYRQAFDGTHIYSRPTPPRSPEAIREAVREAKSYGKISTVTVSPGFDDTGILGTLKATVAPRRDGELYEQWWKIALKVNPDWVLITSWNEWMEGSEIEPTVEYGKKYLELTRGFVEMFKTPSPNLEYSNLELSKDRVVANEPFTVSATANNVGGLGLTEVKLYIDGDLVQTKELIVNKDTKEINFTIRLYKPGTHEVTINGLFPKPIMIEPQPATFKYSNLEVSIEGDNIVSSVEVLNAGSYTATKTLELYVNGEMVKAQEVTLEPGGMAKVSFKYKIKEFGSYEIKIGELSESILIF